MLKLVLPKGSLEKATLALFEAADLPVKRGSDRDYHGTIDDPRVERVSLRLQRSPSTSRRASSTSHHRQGLDRGRQGKVVSLAELPYSKQTRHPVKVILAVHRDLGITDPAQLRPGLRVSTEFPNLTRALLREPRPAGSSRPTAPQRPRCPRSSTRSST